MIFRPLALVSALFSLLLASCGTSSLTSLPASAAGSGAFPTAAPSAKTLAAAAAKPKDRHGFPAYAFKDRTRIVRTTAYTCSEADHLVYGSSNATGTPLRYSNRVRSAAADWSFYPVGTVFRIAGLPYLYVVDDYGSALTGNGTVDIYTPSKGLMNTWGRRNVELTIVQWGSFNRSAQILSQRTKHGHCRTMLANLVRQRPDLAGVASR